MAKGSYRFAPAPSGSLGPTPARPKMPRRRLFLAVQEAPPSGLGVVRLPRRPDIRGGALSDFMPHPPSGGDRGSHGTGSCREARLRPGRSRNRRTAQPAPRRTAATRRCGLRRGMLDLERHDRQTTRPHREGKRRGGHCRLRELRSRQRAAAVDPRRRPQHCRHGALRRGPDDRHEPATRGAGRARPPHRPRRGGRHLGRRRS